MRVALMGTCNDSKWRETMKPLLKCEYFDPVVDDWNEEAQKQEIYEREHCDFVLYVITPMMTGIYAIAEVVDDSNKRPEKTLFCFFEDDNGKFFTEAQKKSLNAVGCLVNDNGGRYYTFNGIIDFLNSRS